MKFPYPSHVVVRDVDVLVEGLPDLEGLGAALGRAREGLLHRVVDRLVVLDLI